MGALPNVFTGYQQVANDEARAKFEKAWHATLSGTPGLTIMEIMNAHEGTIKALYIMGENPMLSDPDLTHVEEALKNLDLLITQDIFLNETGQFAHVVLPSACFAEKDGTFSNTERRVQRIRKAVEPPGAARPDWAIIAEIATRMGYPMNYESAESIMEEINAVTPSYAGITYERIEGEGLQWPCPNREHPAPGIFIKTSSAGEKDFLPPSITAPPMSCRMMNTPSFSPPAGCCTIFIRQQ